MCRKCGGQHCEWIWKGSGLVLDLRVQHGDGVVEETVSEPTGIGPKAPVPSPWWEEDKQSMVGLWGFCEKEWNKISK